MEFEISKIDAAVEQLDWAIRLFLDHKAYVPAITLAGVADEVLGKAVGSRAAFEILKRTFAAQLSKSEKDISQGHLNKAKNWLKHWDGRADNEKIRLDLDEEAIQYILRALANLVAHDKSVPSEGPRFWAWMSAHRPDLLEKHGLSVSVTSDENFRIAVDPKPSRCA
ncbi:MAG: hypothetical protein ACREET_12715 [Stellaceae bacterium]